MFGKTWLVTPYFQQMTLRSKIPENISHLAPKMDLSVNYFGVEYELVWSGVSIILIILGAECFS